MASSLEVHLILCDAAQAESGKIHMLGAGWSITGSPTAPHAVAVLIKVPWDRANQPMSLNLQMLEADGSPVTVATPDGRLPIAANAKIEVGRPPGLAPGSMLDASFALNIPSLPLAPGRYEWRLMLADQQFLHRSRFAAESARRGPSIGRNGPASDRGMACGATAIIRPYECGPKPIARRAPRPARCPSG